MTRPSVCNSCRSHLKNRLRNRILLLQARRRPYHATCTRVVEVTTPEKSHSWYWDTVPPTSSDLLVATNFFRAHLPRKLWTATEWRKQNEPVDGRLVPEVAFLGRSNVGKSSLLNALLASPKLNHVGARPGKTTTMHAWGLAASDPRTGGALKGHMGDTNVKIAVLDMPGYGHASHGDWGNEIITYLRQRKQLKRVFVLLDALHGVKDSDVRMLDLLRKQAISHQIIASKCDRLIDGKVTHTALTEALWKMRDAAQPKSCTGGFVGLGEILVVGALGDGKKIDSVNDKAMIGIEEVRYAVLKAAGLEYGKSVQDVIPRWEGKALPSFLDWKPSIAAEEPEAVATERTSRSTQRPSDLLEAKNSEPLPSTEATPWTDATQNPPRTLEEAPSATFQPFLSSHRAPISPDTYKARARPSSDPPRTFIHKQKAEPVRNIHKTAAILAADTVHKALATLPTPGAQDSAKPYAGSVGYGLRDLYEMTKRKPDSDNKRVMTHLVLDGRGTRTHRQRSKLTQVNPRPQQRQRPNAIARVRS